MVRVDMITTAGALLAGLAIRTALASSAIINPAEHVMRNLATSTTSSPCGAEAQDCAADEDCPACSQSYNDEAQACGEVAVASGITDPCELLEDILCCATEVNNCWNNAALAAFLECAQDTSLGSSATSPSCAAAFDITTCEGAVADASSTSGPSPAPMEDDDVCQAEQEACEVDPECVSCAVEIGDASAAVEEAEAACGEGSDGVEVAANSCGQKSDVACCSLDAYPECAVANEAMVALLDCTLAASLAAEDDTCEFSITDCDTSGVDTSTTSGDGESDTADGATATTGDDDGETDADEGTASTTSDGGEGENAEDAEAADTGSATAASAVVGGTTAVLLAAAASFLAVMAA
eukprot:g1593.t1